MTTKKIILYFFLTAILQNSVYAQENDFPNLKLEAGDTNFYQIRAKLYKMLEEAKGNGIKTTDEDGISANIA
jgi:hypothetical protein